MASIARLDAVSPYLIRRFKNDLRALDAVKQSNCVYVGNLSFYTTEEQIYALFSKCGEIRRIIMGVDRFTKVSFHKILFICSSSSLLSKLSWNAIIDARLVLIKYYQTPCGFCFVEYFENQDALDSLKYISRTSLDERIIRADLDHGYEEGRQYGRGASGGQVRDEMREEFDPGRGGM